MNNPDDKVEDHIEAIVNMQKEDLIRNYNKTNLNQKKDLVIPAIFKIDPYS